MNDEQCENDERRSSFKNGVHRSVRGARLASFYMYTQYTCIIIIQYLLQQIDYSQCTSTRVDYMYTFVHCTRTLDRQSFANGVLITG